MRLYHRWISHNIYLLGVIFLVTWMAACSAPQVTQGLISVYIQSDGKEYQVRIPAGSNVEDALSVAELRLNELDRTEPPLFTVLSDASEIRLIRVQEEYYIEQVVIPFEHQELRNEALAVGERLLSQPGMNGLQEITYRRLLEDGIEISNSVIKTEIVQDAIPEIVMTGSQTPYASLTIPGKIAYLSAGNAWLMEGTTGNRRAVITTGDLDGRIFSLSPDGDWLLFTRSAGEDNTINQLWVARLDTDEPILLYLGVQNVIHFADWGAGLSVVGYSTVEPRSTAPGWQANNDLSIVGVSPSGFVSPPRPELEANSGGVYGWWGMNFRWADDGVRLAYARPDSIGIYDTRRDILQSLVDLIPYQTGGDWAWVPGVSWAPDGNVIYTVSHTDHTGNNTAEESTNFDLMAIPLSGGSAVNLVRSVGMFSYPEPSPLVGSVIRTVQDDSNVPLIENSYQIAYLQAIFPAQSDSSRYRLFIMDRDGSNRVSLFPEEGASGLEPQRVVWSPSLLGQADNFTIAVIYQGDIWLVDSGNGLAQQLTGDGLTVRIDWR